jgi:CheY-like chemotaxis protein
MTPRRSISSSSQPPAVLVVDDNLGNRTMTVDMFQALGFSVHDASNGWKALDLLAVHPEINLLFTDVRMPGLDGPALAREAQAMRPGLKVMLTSGYLDGTPVGDLPFLRKPYRMRDFAALVHWCQAGIGDGTAGITAQV